MPKPPTTDEELLARVPAKVYVHKAEREFLVRELSRAVGLGGRDRFRVRASPCERHARRAPGTRSHS